MQLLCVLVIAVVVRLLPPMCVCEFTHVVAVAVHVCTALLVLWLRLLIRMLVTSSCHCSMLLSLLMLVSSLMHVLFCSGCVVVYSNMLLMAAHVSFPVSLF